MQSNRDRRVSLDPVLVVDDDDDFRDLARARLVAHGYQVVEARHGREALDFLTGPSAQPSAIVLDLQMPTMSGWDLLPILASYLRLQSIPLVIVTAWAGDPQRLAPWRPAAVLSKDDDLGRLCEVLASSIGAHSD
jgi:chemotaxis family two-component system sensor histidine kinase/response regulator PixL